MFRIICDHPVEQIFPHKITNRSIDGKILIKKSQVKKYLKFSKPINRFIFCNNQRNARNHVRTIEISVKNLDGETKNWRRVKFSRSPKVGPIFLEFEKQTNKKGWNLRS